MPINQLDVVFQFSLQVTALLAVSAVGIKVARMLARPCGILADGRPERRSRKRIVLRDPEAVAAARLHRVESNAVA